MGQSAPDDGMERVFRSAGFNENFFSIDIFSPVAGLASDLVAETFECPKCKKEYPHEKRRVGKAVACECGHRFLVPPREPPSAPLVGIPIEAGAPPAAAPPTPSPSTPGPGEGTILSALPARGALPARPVAPRPATPLPAAKPAAAKPVAPRPARWADPVSSPAPAPLTEGDLMDGAPPAPFIASAADLSPPAASPQAPVYASVAPLPEAVLPPNPYKPPREKKRSKGASQATRELASKLGLWAASFTLLVFLPAAIFFALLAAYRYSNHGWEGRPVNVAPRFPSAPPQPPVAIAPAPLALDDWRCARG